MEREEIIEKFIDEFGINLNDVLSDYQKTINFLKETNVILIRIYSGHNPIIQDELSVNLQILDEKFNGDEKIKDKNDMEQIISEYFELLHIVSNHAAIGRRLGLDMKKLGIYDALVGYFDEKYEAVVVDVALDFSKRLTKYLASHKTNENLRANMEKLIDKSCEKNMWELDCKEDFLNYLCLDIIPAWKNQNLSDEPADL